MFLHCRKLTKRLPTAKTAIDILYIALAARLITNQRFIARIIHNRLQ